MRALTDPLYQSGIEMVLFMSFRSLRGAIAALVFLVLPAALLGGCTIVVPPPQAQTASSTTTVTAPPESISKTSVSAVESSNIPANPVYDESDPSFDLGPATDYNKRCVVLPERPECTSDFLESVYSGAGGAIPPEATAATAIRPDGRTAVIKTASGNIGCDISEDYSGCGVLSMQGTVLMGTDSRGRPNWWVDLPTDGDSELIPEVMDNPEGPLFEDADVPAQVLNYGQVIRHGEVVCASESEGLTCWNMWTGHGSFMNKDWIYTC